MNTAAQTKYYVTVMDRHGQLDVVDVYAASNADVLDALHDVYGDDYTAVVSVDVA